MIKNGGRGGVAGIIARDGLDFVGARSEAGETGSNAPDVGELLALRETDAIAVEEKLHGRDRAVTIGGRDLVIDGRRGLRRTDDRNRRDYGNVAQGVDELNGAFFRAGGADGAAGETGRGRDRVGVGGGIGENAAVGRGGANASRSDRRNGASATTGYGKLNRGGESLVGERDGGFQIDRRPHSGDGAVIYGSVERDDGGGRGRHREGDDVRDVRVAGVVRDRDK